MPLRGEERDVTTPLDTTSGIKRGHDADTTSLVESFEPLRKVAKQTQNINTAAQAPYLGLNDLHEILPFRSKDKLSARLEFLQDAVFVCLDFEAFESAQHIITEIGVSVLDSTKLADLEPGPGGSNWFQAIESAHFRPLEHRQYVNGKYVRGCPDDFQFGSTTFVNLQDVGEILRRVFRDPTRLSIAADLDRPISDAKRNIVFVGHDLRNDLKSARYVDFAPTNVAARADTCRLPGIGKRRQIGLASLLDVLGLDYSFLHNAGNDAAFTLRAMVATAARDIETPGSVARDVRLLFEERAARQEAKRLKREDAQTVRSSGKVMASNS